MWHERLFSPFVEAGIYDEGGMRGFRNQPVYLRGSRHVPPREGVLLDAMSALYEQLEVEGSPAVRAVAGHWLFGHIHPHRDGNGRLAAPRTGRVRKAQALLERTLSKSDKGLD